MPPDAPILLHLIGDLHAGAITQQRRDKVLADVNGGHLPTPDLHVQIGDATENGAAGEDTTAKAWLDAHPADWVTVCGNHDRWLDSRTAAQWATAYGMPGANYTRDVGDVRLVVLAWESAYATMVATQAQLDWLDDQLATADRDCLILCHAPLANTVLGDPNHATDPQNTTSDSWFFADQVQARPTADILAILAARPRAKAWISGHTHSDTHVAGFLKAHDVGGRTIASINCSALYYTGRFQTENLELHSPLKTLYLSVYLNSDWKIDRLEVRVRDHGTQAWAAIAGQRVTTLEPTP